MSKGGGTQTTSTNLDPGTQQYLDAIRRRAIGMTGGGQQATYADPQRAAQLQAIAAKGGILGTGAQRKLDAMRQGGGGAGGGNVSATADPGDPYVQQAIGGYQQFANLGMTGANALAGDPNAVGAMMNPYNATMNPYWDQMRQQTLGAVGNQATLAGAYGGSRHGVAEGQGLADIANQQAGQRYGEFGNAMGRAGQLANLGFSANQGLFGAGDYLRNRDIDLLMKSMGPYGQTQSQPTQGGGIAGLLGTGLSIASLIPGPWQVPAVAATAASRGVR